LNSETTVLELIKNKNISLKEKEYIFISLEIELNHLNNLALDEKYINMIREIKM